MSDRKYWQSYEELYKDPEYQATVENEFHEKLPFASFELEKKTAKPRPRRDFLKLLGFSIGAATIAASCEQPIRKAIPYVIKPEEIIPGIANYYASAFVDGSDFGAVLVKTREGRPIKIEGNPEDKYANGSTSSRAQASVISLYDGSRLAQPFAKGEGANWGEIDDILGPDIRAIAANGGKIVLLSSSIISPSTKALLREFKDSYTGFEHVVFEPMSYYGMLQANEKTFGKKAIPSYDFNKAEAIVSFEADFLNSWLLSHEYHVAYAKNRKISRKNPKMSKHIQFESVMSSTGSNADNRYRVSPSELKVAVAKLYNEIAASAGGASVPGVPNSGSYQQGIKKAARVLLRNKGKSIVISGSNDPNVQTLVNGINQMLNNYGQTIDINKPTQGFQGNDESMQALIKAMDAGEIDALLVHNCNPSYSYSNPKAFNSAVAKVPLRVSFNPRADETSDHMDYLLPDNHYLESWNDAEPVAGRYYITQPCIRPLFDTRQFQESLLKWLGKEEGYFNYIQSYWKDNLAGKQSKYPSFETFWANTVHNGMFESSASSASESAIVETLVSDDESEVTFEGNPSSAGKAILEAAKNVGEVELVLYESYIGDGKHANNPFLQELPDPITKVVWENVALMSKATAKEKGFREGDTIRISANGHSVELPVIFQPGMAANTIGVAVGYGRTKAGSESCNVGMNVYPFVRYNEGTKTFDYGLSDIVVQKIGSGGYVARTQTHHNINDYLAGEDKPSSYDRSEKIVRETTLAEYKKDLFAGNEDGKKYKDPHYVDHYKVSLYEGFPELQQGHHWGMAIDMNTCTGCSACVVACNIENNVPLVGREEVFRVHEMTWLKIDRYYTGKDDNVDVIYQPMMCQHCDNAPCENVCPVSATNHSSEGLNQMAYNRCIGTRYCANNCPFKVRRFNWYDWQGADSFEVNTIFSNDGHVIQASELSRMVLNPDVTVRSRGVMEKCSFCVQRIQDAKLTAKKEGRKLKDGEVKTACSQACPSDAIVFGDMNDKNSEVYKLREYNERSYNLLEELHVLPSVGYLTKIRNKDKSEMVS